MRTSCRPLHQQARKDSEERTENNSRLPMVRKKHTTEERPVKQGNQMSRFFPQENNAKDNS